MYNIKVLEEEWKRYNRKKKRPWIIGGTLLILLSAALIVLMDHRSILKTVLNKMDTHTSETKSNALPEKIYIDSAFDKLEKKNTYAVSDVPMEPEVIIDDEERTSHTDAESEAEKKIHIEVVEADNRDAYKEVEKRFRMGHDIDDSLFLAKAYYLKGQYKKAEYWALQTNKINENIEDSWLIFVKSKVKRGQTNEAIRILNRYIDKTDSSEAKVLLEKIKKGSL